MAAAVAMMVTFTAAERDNPPDSPVELPFSVWAKVCGRADDPTVNVTTVDAEVVGTGARGLVTKDTPTLAGIPEAASVTLSPKSPSANAVSSVEATPPSGMDSVSGSVTKKKSCCWKLAATTWAASMMIVVDALLGVATLPDQLLK